MSEQASTLYERLGGQEKLAKIIFDMYKLVLSDPDLAPFFKDVPIERLSRMNAEFIGAALDGPIQYSGKDLVAAHSGMNVTRQHFSKFVGYLATALEQHGIAKQDVDAVLGRLAMMAGKITGDANIDG
jgi:hemoglobin